MLTSPLEKRTNRSLVIFITIAVIAAGFIYGLSMLNNRVSNSGIKEVMIGNSSVKVTLAISSDQKEKGLSIFDQLDENSGMLFVYDGKIKPGFWMKGMKFPIDIIWIAGEQVVGLEAKVPVNSEGSLPIYKPEQDINKVLEVNAGWAEAHGVEVGDKVKFR